MKNLLALTLIMVALNSSAAVNSVDTQQKLVNWTPTNTLEVNLTEVDADDDNYAILSYRWSLEVDQYNSESDNLKRTYPGYTLVRNDIESIQGFTLSVPQANYSLPLTAYPSQSGFYSENNAVLSKAQYLAISDAKTLSPNSFVKLFGTAHTHVEVINVVESKTLTPDICQGIYGSGTLGDVLQNAFNYGAQVEKNHDIKNPETFKLFISAIQRSCFTLSQSGVVSSVEDLLGLKMKMSLSTNTQVNYTTTSSQALDLAVPYVVAPWQSK